MFGKDRASLIRINTTLPLIQIAGAACFDELMMPVSLAISERCDTCPWIDGPSHVADDAMKKFKVIGEPVYASIAEVMGA